jgi:hypothetical protein
MGERATSLFPFGIAIVLPPAGVLLGILNFLQGQRDLGMRLVAVSLIAAIVWVLLFVV